MKRIEQSHLLTGDFAELRAAGWMLLQKLPPHLVAAALDHAKRVIGKAPRMLKSAVVSYLRALEGNVERFDRAVLRSKQDLKHLYASLRIAPTPRAAHPVRRRAAAGQPAAGAQAARASDRSG